MGCTDPRAYRARSEKSTRTHPLPHVLSGWSANRNRITLSQGPCLERERFLRQVLRSVFSPYSLNIEVSHLDPLEAHPSFVNFKKPQTTTSAEDLSELMSTPWASGWNGWIMDKHNNLVMWVPDEYRASLLWRGMVLLIGQEPLEIDFANVHHGSEWDKCNES